jgi:hypothetical protein
VGVHGLLEPKGELVEGAGLELGAGQGTPRVFGADFYLHGMVNDSDMRQERCAGK